MAWVGHSAAAYALYIPMALAGALTPYTMVPDAQPRAVLLGFAVLMGTLAELLTGAGLGAGYVLAAWAMAAVIASLFGAKASQYTSKVHSHSRLSMFCRARFLGRGVQENFPCRVHCK